MANYEESFVAFLDILGFKNIVNTSEFEQVLNIFETITEEVEKKTQLNNRTTSDISLGEKLIREHYDDALNNTKIHIMSDSVVIATPCTYEESLAVVVDICQDVQMRLYKLTKPVLLRGAISKGDIYVGKSKNGERVKSSYTLIFGEGLVNAYVAQEYYALYPRIIISKEVMNGYKTSITDEQPLPEDEIDGYCYLDTLMKYLLKEDTNARAIGDPMDFYTHLFESSEEYKSIIGLISENLSGYNDVGIRQKYIWLKREVERAEKAYLDSKGIHKDVSFASIEL